MATFYLNSSDEQVWSEAVTDVAQQYFIRPVILFMDFSEPPVQMPRTLLALPIQSVDGVTETLKKLGKYL